MKARNHARQHRGRPTHDYWLAYHACHAAIYRVVARRGSDHGYAAVPGGDFIEACPQCGRLLVAADVRRWHELSQHPGGIGRTLRDWSRERKKGQQNKEQNG
jgi:hypothetical protein